MSEFDEQVEKGGGMTDTAEMSNSTETYDEIISRHKSECRELEGKVRAMLKKAKKSNKAEVEAQTIQMDFDLKQKHRDEIEEFEEKHGDIEDIAKNFAETIIETKENNAIDDTEQKKTKAKKKQEKKKNKELEMEKKKEEIRASVGPSLRDVELDKIKLQLSKESLTIKEIISDGNCLYRAIADQFNLSSLPNSTGKLDFQAVRRLAADHIRSNAEVYAPFMGISASSEDFNTYCFKVESSELAEWGGELELRALAEALQREILVYSADAPVLTMTAVYVSNPIPLRLSFHQHYYSLGEHYNSVIPNVN